MKVYSENSIKSENKNRSEKKEAKQNLQRLDPLNPDVTKQ